MSDALAAKIARALAYPFDPHPEPFLFTRGCAAPLDHADPALFEGRVPVLAVGSNASPKRLAEKFGRDTETPVTFAVVEDHVVAHSAKFTRYGSMPATLHPWSGARARVHATWLTEAQLAVMDATESLGIEYERVAITATLLDAPAYTGPIETYLSIVGALVHEGAPVVSTSAQIEGAAPRAHDQRKAQAIAIAHLGLAHDVETFIAENLADDALRRARIEELSTRAGLPYAPRRA
jgi:hypothetical protein